MVIKLYSRFIRYFLILIWTLIFVFASQIFFQNFNMNFTREDLKVQQKKLLEETLWASKYYKPYLHSQISQLIFSHRNGVLTENEIVVNIVPFENEDDTQVNKYEKTIEKNKLTWNEFFLQMLWKLDLIN